MDRRTAPRSTNRRGTRTTLRVAIFAASVLASCGSHDPSTSDDGSTAAAATSGDSTVPIDDADFVLLMTTIQDAVTEWSEATAVDDATAAAEGAANLVVGPNGPGYGDRNGDGIVTGETDAGLLSGVDGEPEGLAVPLTDNECVAKDVLGATANDVAAGWTEMESAIAAWTPDDNTMPSLSSHPMRVVGWATFTIASESLEDAHEYASHAQLHVDVALDALDC